MSELTLLLIRIAYLAVLWIFVLAALSVIRSDMFGARVPETARRDAQPKPSNTSKRPKRGRGQPTHVIVVNGEHAGQTADLSSGMVLIGRGADAAIRLDDDYASTRHARIVFADGQWFVEDLGSTNGTYLGTVRITQPTPINLDSQVRIGKTILELRK